MAGKDRKKELARQRYERQQQRRAQEAARARRLKIISAAAAVAVIVVGGAAFMVFTGKDDESTAAGPKCTYKAAQQDGAPKGIGTPPAKPAYTGIVQTTVKTNQGDVEMQLYGGKAPCTVNSFTYLAQKNFFDKTQCHRLTSGGLNVLQCGDPTAKGTGGPGYQFANENTDGAMYTEGTLAMAHSSLPDSNGSQFFMVYKDSQLPPEYTVFGKITKGLDVLQKIAKAGSDPKGDGKPKKKVEIQDVTIAGK